MIDKVLKLAGKVMSQTYGQHRVVSVDLTDDDVAQLVLALTMLERDLVQTVRLAWTNKPGMLVLANAPRIGRGERGTWTEEGNSAIIRLSEVEIDYSVAFLLGYVRDGLAPVDHIDVDVDSPMGGEDVTLTLRVARVSRPIPGDALARELGLEPES